MTERSYAPEAPVLETSVLYEFAETFGPNGPEMLGRAVGTFIEVTPPLLTTLASAIRDEDTTQVADIAHRLRGSSISLGAYALAERCVALEQSPPHALAAKSLAVSVEYRRAVTALRTFLESIGGTIPGPKP
ncbi:MAG: Hpt domain-containing protein [Oscillochloris sp.]|nr:Hpt domain-containing protein [Oscillochloris sp.]